MKPVYTYVADSPGIVKVYSLFNNSYALSANSDAFRPGALKKGSLIIRANVGSGNLVCTFVLAARQDPTKAFVAVGGFSFATGPNGTAFTQEYAFDNMNAYEYQLQMTRASGTGPLLVDITVS